MAKRLQTLLAGSAAGLVLLAVSLIAVFGAATPAHAQIDISGEWNFAVLGFGPEAIPCPSTIAQTGATFTIDTECTNVGLGSFVGEIDIETGEFTATGSIAGIPIEMAGIASPDGETIEGTWDTSFGFSGTLTAVRSGPAQTPTPLPTLPAPVDLTGTWRIQFLGIFSGTCESVIEQTGTELLSIAQCPIIGTTHLTGTLDQARGEFTLTSSIVNLEGVAAADGNSITGTWSALGFGGGLTGERVDDIELVDISGEWGAVLLGDDTDTCALEIEQDLLAASAVLNCEELGQRSLEGSVNPFSGSLQFFGTMGDADTSLSGQLSADGSYIFGREFVRPLALSGATSTARTFIAVPAGELERGIVLLNCRPEEEVVWISCAYGAGFGETNEFPVEVQIAVAPLGGYGGLDATVSWADSLDFLNSMSECQSGFAVGEQQSISLSCALDTHGDFVGNLFALTMTCDPGSSGKAITLSDASFQDVGGDLGPPTLIDASVTCFGPQFLGPPLLIGDADCSSDVSSIDAALVLQYEAGLLDFLPCPFQADVNGDGTIDSRDALLILQTTAGLI